MKHKISYIATPALVWCLIPKDQIKNIITKGITPGSKDMFDIKQLKRKKVIYGVRSGDEESLIRLARMLGTYDNQTVEVAVPAYYKCVTEVPENAQEQELFRQVGAPHKNIFIIPNKIKPKYINIASIPDIASDKQTDTNTDQKNNGNTEPIANADANTSYNAEDVSNEYDDIQYQKTAEIKTDEAGNEFIHAEEVLSFSMKNSDTQEQTDNNGPELTDAMKALGLTQADLDRMKAGQ